MKKLLFILLTSAAFTSSAQNADTSLWKFKGLTSLNFTQVYLNNWAAGGQNSVAMNSLLNINANYAKDKHIWENRLDLAYGLVSQGGQDFQKTDDRIDLLSKYGREAFGSKHWFFSALLNFKSQFAEGYNLPDDSTVISEFMAPGYVMASVGFDYKKNENLSIYISPLTSKFTFVNNQILADAGAFGVEEAVYDAMGNKTKDGENLRAEFGGSVNILWTQDIVENVTFSSRLELFSNYLDNPDHIDVFLEGILAMKINDFLSANITANVIYDHDIDILEVDSKGNPKLDDEGNQIVGPRTQLKEVFSLGIQYTFGNAK